MNKYISVVMATFNGSLYIEDQLKSILSEIDVDSEVVIYDDASTDSTVELIEKFNDDRVIVIQGIKNVGVNRAFEFALMRSTGKYIFLSDQDDVWKTGRVLKMVESLKSSNDFLVTGCFDFIDENSNELEYKFEFLKSKNSRSKFANILKIFSGRANYYGCAMAIDRDFLSYVIPFPLNIESHDLWFALYANYLNKNIHLDEVVLSRRLHGNNLSIVNRSLRSKLLSRYLFITQILAILKNK